MVGVFYRVSTAGDVAFAEQLLDTGAGEIGEGNGQHAVETLARLGFVDRHCVP